MRAYAKKNTQTLNCNFSKLQKVYSTQQSSTYCSGSWLLYWWLNWLCPFQLSVNTGLPSFGCLWKTSLKFNLLSNLILNTKCNNHNSSYIYLVITEGTMQSYKEHSILILASLLYIGTHVAYTNTHTQAGNENWKVTADATLLFDAN